MEVRYDPAKREKTLVRRGLDFEDAPKLFDGPTLTVEDNRIVYPEPRYQTYGWLGTRLVMTVWTPMNDGLRVISMRHCHGKERRRIEPRLG